MEYMRQWGKVIVLGGLVGMLSISCDRTTQNVSETNNTLSAIKLPSLPDGATDVRCEQSGLFAKFVNVRFAAPPEKALEYLVSCEAPYYSEFRMTDGGYEVTETHVMTKAPDTTTVRVPPELTLSRGMGGRTWFKSVYRIRHGWFYRSKKPPVRYQLYYDLDTGQFYIYWSYS